MVRNDRDNKFVICIKRKECEIIKKNNGCKTSRSKKYRKMCKLRGEITRGNPEVLGFPPGNKNLKKSTR